MAIPKDTLDTLYPIAEAQAGYFTTHQAEAADVSRVRLSRYAGSGRVQRVRRGVYRLAYFPRSRYEDLFIAWLEAGPDAAISHDSALMLYELSDALPAAIHLTVPRTASRRRPGLHLHTNRISPTDIVNFEGLPVTTVARTIVDVAVAGLADELVEQAVQEAISQGLVQPEDLRMAAERRSKRVHELMSRLLDKVNSL
jgi:predicted transcriptional regulator of viral defense system